MIPAGYMAKRVMSIRAESFLEWLGVAGVRDFYSVSGCCVPENFVDFIDYWKHNGYWFFNSPEAIAEIAEAEGVLLVTTKLFYYEVYEQEYDQDTGQWNPFSPDASFETHVVIPEQKSIEGYDVATFMGHNIPESSPLSCCGLASKISVNEHCLIPTLEEAIAAIESGKFKEGEPGPLRVFAVYSVAAPWQ